MSYSPTLMPSLPLPQLIGDARARWLKGDPQAWNRYVACCLELDAELRTVPDVQTPAVPPARETSSPPAQQAN